MASALYGYQASNHNLRHRVLVCIDRSDAAEGCLLYAVALARAFDSHMTLLRVLQPLHAPQDALDALTWEIARQEANALLARFRAQAIQTLGRDVDVRLEQGHPAERIIDVADELGVDLTVLGSHGESGDTRWNLGSTAQQVLSVARNSVLIAHASRIAPLLRAPKRILVPLDGSIRAESALPTAVKLAQAHAATLLLAHVVQAPMATELMQHGPGFVLAEALATHLEGAAQHYLGLLERRIAHQYTQVATLTLKHVNARRGLLDLVRAEHIDLVILSAHGIAADATRPLGSVTTYLLHNATVPVLVLQDLPTDNQRCDFAPIDAPVRRGSYAQEQHA